MKLDRTVWQTAWAVIVLIITWSPPAPIKPPIGPRRRRH
jgi:hypothetical protein